jgi:hypothetical protein
VTANEATGGDGWTELQDDGSLEDTIQFHNGDEASFFAKLAFPRRYESCGRRQVD